MTSFSFYHFHNIVDFIEPIMQSEEFNLDFNAMYILKTKLLFGLIIEIIIFGSVMCS